MFLCSSSMGSMWTNISFYDYYLENVINCLLQCRPNHNLKFGIGFMVLPTTMYDLEPMQGVRLGLSLETVDLPPCFRVVSHWVFGLIKTGLLHAQLVSPSLLCNWCYFFPSFLSVKQPPFHVSIPWVMILWALNDPTIILILTALVYFLNLQCKSFLLFHYEYPWIYLCIYYWISAISEWCGRFSATLPYSDLCREAW